MDKTANQTVDAALQEMSKKELGDIKVFIVEDDKMIRELVVTKLTQNGCIPYSTEDGREAIALAEQYSPDVIILDLMLPGMTGEEILTALKKHDTLKTTPVIVFSNKSDEEDINNVLKLGAARYYIKAMTNLNDFVSDLKQLAKHGAA